MLLNHMIEAKFSVAVKKKENNLFFTNNCLNKHKNTKLGLVYLSVNLHIFNLKYR